jgi:uncharacterized tellurite resistance protein B-like protein
MVISSVVANAATLFKNHFTINDAEWEALANSAYDATHEFVSLYDFSSLGKSDDNNSPETML